MSPKIFITAVALLASFPASAQGWSDGRVYKCTPVQLFNVADITDEGIPLDPASKSTSFSFTYNEGTGDLHWIGTDITRRFQTLSPGTRHNSMKAVRSYNGLANTVVESLQIVTWEDLKVNRPRTEYPFFYNNDGVVHVGTCIDQ